MCSISYPTHHAQGGAETPSGLRPNHESPLIAESRSAPQSTPPLLRLKASPSREALSRPYPSGLGDQQDTKSLRQHEISQKYASRHGQSHQAKSSRHTRSHRRTRQLLLRRMTRFQAMLFFRVSSCCRRPFVFDDATKPERVNTAKRQRAKRA